MGLATSSLFGAAATGGTMRGRSILRTGDFTLVAVGSPNSACGALISAQVDAAMSSRGPVLHEPVPILLA